MRELFERLKQRIFGTFGTRGRRGGSGRAVADEGFEALPKEIVQAQVPVVRDVCLDDLVQLSSQPVRVFRTCLLYTSDAADDLLCVGLGGRRII